MVTILNPVGGIYTADITIETILRSGQQAGTCGERAIFKPGVALEQDKTIPVIVRARAIEIPCTTEPLCGTRICNKVVDCASQRGRPHSDGYPERSIRRRCGSEDFAFIIANLPVTAVDTFNDGCSEIHRNVNSLAWSNLHGQWHKVLSPHPITTDQYDTISCLPSTGT